MNLNGCPSLIDRARALRGAGCSAPRGGARTPVFSASALDFARGRWLFRPSGRGGPLEFPPPPPSERGPRGAERAEARGTR